MEYEIHRHDSFVEIVTHGDGDAGVFRAILAEAMAHEDWKPGTSILIDHSDLNAGPLTVAEMSEIADMIEAGKAELGASRMAVLAPGDLEFGLGRMWLVFVENRWEGTGKLFRSREDAVSWLEQPI